MIEMNIFDGCRLRHTDNLLFYKNNIRCIHMVGNSITQTEVHLFLIALAPFGSHIPSQELIPSHWLPYQWRQLH